MKADYFRFCLVFSESFFNSGHLFVPIPMKSSKVKNRNSAIEAIIGEFCPFIFGKMRYTPNPAVTFSLSYGRTNTVDHVTVQPGPEVTEQLSMYQASLKEKTKQMKAMAAELNMYQAQVIVLYHKTKRYV